MAPLAPAKAKLAPGEAKAKKLLARLSEKRRPWAACDGAAASCRIFEALPLNSRNQPFSASAENGRGQAPPFRHLTSTHLAWAGSPSALAKRETVGANESKASLLNC
jgi:hypothetical protein